MIINDSNWTLKKLIEAKVWTKIGVWWRGIKNPANAMLMIINNKATIKMFLNGFELFKNKADIIITIPKNY